MRARVVRASFIVWVLLALVLVQIPVAPAAPEISLTLTCRCVAGGVANNTVVWFHTYLKPRFETTMRIAGTPVNVTLIEFGGSDEALKQQYALDLRVGRGADVMAFDGFWVPEFAAGGLVKPLDQIAGPEVNEWEGWNHTPKSIRALLEFDGKLYGIPTGTDVRQIFIRKDLFQRAGLPADWQPKSWAELLAAARQIKQRLPDVVPLQINAGTAMGEATTLQGWFMVLLGAGSHVYDFQTKKWIVRSQAILDALNFYKTVYVDEELGDARIQLLTGGRDRSFVLFRDAKIAMLVEGDFFWRSVLAPGSATALPNRNELVGWAKMPAKDPGKGFRDQNFVTASGGTGYILNPKGKNPKMAWELLSMMFSQRSLLEFQKIEPRIRARDDVPVTGDPVMSEMAKQLLPLTAVRPQLPEYPKVSVEIQLMTERVVSGQMTPQQAMDAYARAVSQIVGAANTVDLLRR